MEILVRVDIVHVGFDIVVEVVVFFCSCYDTSGRSGYVRKW